MAVIHMVAFKDMFTSTLSLYFSRIRFCLLRFCVHDISFLYEHLSTQTFPNTYVGTKHSPLCAMQ